MKRAKRTVKRCREAQHLGISYRLWVAYYSKTEVWATLWSARAMYDAHELHKRLKVEAAKARLVYFNGKAKLHMDKVYELSINFVDSLMEESKKMLRSGGIDIDSFSTDEYALAKILITAAIYRSKNNYMPIKQEYTKAVKNLRNM